MATTAGRTTPRTIVVALGLGVALVAGACGADSSEQAQVVAVTPTPFQQALVPTTAAVTVPTPVPSPTPVVLPSAVATLVPSPTAEPTPEPTPTAVATPTGETDVSPDPTATPIATAAPVPSPTTAAAAQSEQAEAGGTDTDEAGETESDGTEGTSAAGGLTPTAVAATGEAPLECYDPVLKIYRGFVEGVDSISFEAGRVECGGAGSNDVSAARTYRHSSGLIVQRNANYILNDSGTSYVPYSGTIHFCLDGQPSSTAVVADTVPALLVVLDSQAQHQLIQGATPPAAFGASGTQC